MTHGAAAPARNDPAVTVAVCALAAAWAGQWAAVLGRSRAAAFAALALYALGFVLLAARRPALAVAALVVAMPLVTIEVGFGDVEKTLSGDKIAIAATGGLWLARRGRAALPSLARHPAVRFWLLLLAITALSAIACGASFGELWGMTGAVLYFVVFALALDLFVNDPGARDRVLAAAALTAGVVAALGLVEVLFLRETPLYFKDGVMPSLHSAGATIGHTSFLAAYLALVLGPLAALACLRATPRRPWLAAAGIATVLMLFAARSAGALLGVSAGVLVALVTGLAHIRSRAARIALVAGAVVVLAVAASIAIDQIDSDVSSISVRVATSRIGLAAIRERPWLGFGTNGYVHEAARLERAVFGRALLEYHPADRPPSAHSAYLNLAVERGLVALGAFIGLLATIAVAGLRRPAGGGDFGHDALAIGLLAGIVAFLTQALFENLFSFSKVTSLLWIMAAALVSLGAGARR